MDQTTTPPPAAPRQITMPELDRLRAHYDGERMAQALTDGVVARYPRARGYAEAIQDVLYEHSPDDRVTERKELSAADRQRCLVAVLAARRERFPLAIHSYVALMEHVTLEELHHVMFLVGVYWGVPSMVSGVDVLDAVERELLRLVDAGTVDVRAVVYALKAAFPS